MTNIGHIGDWEEAAIATFAQEGKFHMVTHVF